MWVAAAWWLWQSRVPDDLRIPDVDAEKLIGAAIVERAERYELFYRVDFVLSTLVLIAVLVAYARWGHRLTRESAAGRIGTGMLLGMLGLAFVWLAQVPFRLAEVWWDRRYDQTDSGYLETLFANWFQLGAEFLFISFALVIVMAIAGRFPRRWWLGAAPVFIGLSALFAFVMPYLSFTDPLTGVGNRRQADALLASLVPGDALLMLDLDHFKSVNDTLGHAVGDAVLTSFARFVERNVRVGDGVARFGGEEFLVVLRATQPGVEEAGLRLVDEWRATDPVTTVSAGLAVHRTGQDPSETLAAADAALYAAKHGGRDRLVAVAS